MPADSGSVLITGFAHLVCTQPVLHSDVCFLNCRFFLNCFVYTQVSHVVCALQSRKCPRASSPLRSTLRPHGCYLLPPMGCDALDSCSAAPIEAPPAWFSTVLHCFKRQLCSPSMLGAPLFVPVQHSAKQCLLVIATP